MHQPFPNTSPPRTNRFSYEPPTSHHNHDPSSSRSRSLEFSPTSLKRSHLPSSNYPEKSALDPRDPRRRLQKADPSRSPPKIQRYHFDYAPKKREGDGSWKKGEPDFEEKMREIDINQDADSVSTNSSDKSAGQSQCQIELSSSSVEERRDPRRDPRLMKRGCQQKIQRKMEVEIKAIFDEDPMIIFSQKKDENSSIISSNIQQEEPLLISPKKKDENSSIISQEIHQDEPQIIPSKIQDEKPLIHSSEKEDEESEPTPSTMKEDDSPKKAPVIIDLEDGEEEQEEQEQETKEEEFEIPKKTTNIDVEEPEEEPERKDQEVELQRQITKIQVEGEEDVDDDQFFQIQGSNIRLYESIGNIDPRKRSQQPTTILINKKLNLVLDLDETLINSHTVSQDFDLKQIKTIPQDSLSVMNNGELKTIIVLRPYYQEFLERMSKHYNLFVYSHGRYDYVQFALEIIDKKQQFISREKIFKNCGQVSRGTSKKLVNLGFTEEEINKTIILDDQRQIWEYEHYQVICSKKFIPLKDFIKEEKYSRYLLFKAKQYEKNWLSGEDNQGELEFYSETHVTYSQQKLNQLELLAHFFEGLAKDHEKTVEKSPEIKIQELCEARMKTILKSMKVGIMSDCEIRKKMFENVAEVLGATVMESDKSHYLVVDHNVSDDEKEVIKSLVEEKPMIIVVSVGWLVECFFRLTKVSVNNFLRKFYF